MGIEQRNGNNTSNYFDRYDNEPQVKSGNYFDKYDEDHQSNRTVLGTAGDIGISALKGAIGVGEAAQGLLDIPTGGRVGKFTENLGYKPKAAREILDQYYSPAQKEANRKLDEAKGFIPTVKTALENPSTIVHGVTESLPVMGAGGVAGQGIGLATKAAPYIAGALGEGLAAMGSAAEQIRQETPDGLLTPAQSAMAVGSGLGTAAFGAAGGKLANVFGFTDIDTMFANGFKNVAKKAGIKEGEQGFAKSVADVAGRIFGGSISEGVFEELPQSVQEQVWQNAALGKPLTEGVPESAAMGLITGAAMGGGINMIPGMGHSSGDAQQPSEPDPEQAASPTPSGPISRALATTTPAITVPPPADDPRMAEEWANQTDAAAQYNQNRLAGGFALPTNQEQAPRPTSNEEKNATMDRLVQQYQEGNVNGWLNNQPPVEDRSIDALPKPEPGVTMRSPEEVYSSYDTETASKRKTEREQAQRPALPAPPWMHTSSTPTSDDDTVKWLQQRAASREYLKEKNTKEVRKKAEQKADGKAAKADPLRTLKDQFQESYDAIGTVPESQGNITEEDAAKFSKRVEFERQSKQRASQASALHQREQEADGYLKDESIPEEVRTSATEQARSVIQSDPVYAHMAEAKKRGKINLEAMKEAYDENTVSMINRRYPGIFSKVGTLNPDEFANEKGYSNLDEMIQRFSHARTQKELIGQLVREQLDSWNNAESEAGQQADRQIERQNGREWAGAGVAVTKKPGTVYPAPSEAVDSLVRIIQKRPELVSEDDIDHWSFNAEQKASLRRAYNTANGEKLRPVREAQGTVKELLTVQPRKTLKQVIAERKAERAALDAQAHEAATSPTNDKQEPTQAQKEAGNYAVGHVTLQGLDISIENPQGSERKGVDPAGNPWSVMMKHHYGYIKGTIGPDKDHVDVFIGPKQESEKVFVVDQVDQRTGKFDEPKVVLGAANKLGAKRIYLSNYEKGWKGTGAITEMSLDQFKAWAFDPRASKKPASEFSGSQISKNEPQTNSSVIGETQKTSTQTSTQKSDQTSIKTVTESSPGKVKLSVSNTAENPADVESELTAKLGRFRVKRLLGKMVNVIGSQEEAKQIIGDVSGESSIQYSVRQTPPPKNTVKAYKLFRVDKRYPGKLFPLFVDANTPVEMGVWLDADEGPLTDKGKVKSKLGPLAYRPGWHAGDIPVATHIGLKQNKSDKAPSIRNPNMVWAEVEMANDVDWQEEANKRGINEKGNYSPVRAHITDQIPKDGLYRYKTNSNMNGNWIISGAMKVNRVLSDEEVLQINEEQGVFDLPRQEPFNADLYGFQVKYSKNGAIQGFAVNGQVYLVKDGIEKGQAYPVLLHELGEHVAQLGFTGDEEYQRLQKGVETRSKRNDATGESIRTAMARVPEDTKQEHYWSEVMAYLVENEANSKLSIVDRILAYFKKLMVKAGVIGADRLNHKDLVVFAQAAVRAASGGNSMQNALLSMRNKFKPVDTESKAFKEWFKGSQVVDEDGKPLVVYHGSPRYGFESFQDTRGKNTKFYMFSTEKAFAENYALNGGNDIKKFNKGNSPGVYSVYLSAKNIFDPEKDAEKIVAEFLKNGGEFSQDSGYPHDIIIDTVKRGNWRWIEDDNYGEGGFLSFIKRKGYDGFFTEESLSRYGNLHTKNIAVFSPTQIKSAISNTGAFSSTDPRIQYSYNQFKTVDPNSTALKRFLGNSQITEPVYHGSPDEFYTFNNDQLGKRRYSPGAGLGFFFATDKTESQGYAGVGGNVKSFYVKIENPKRMQASQLPKFLEADEARAYARRQQLAGYDGIILEDEGHVIVFAPNQVKSAEINTGEFDEKNPDVRYSMAGGGTGITGNGTGPAWETPEDSKKDTFIYHAQDKFIDLKRVQDNIEAAVGPIDEQHDVLLAEELYHKRSAKRIEDMLIADVNPLMKELGRIPGGEMTEFEEYMHALHAPEANESLRQRNPNEEELKILKRQAKEEREALQQSAIVQRYMEKERELTVAKHDVDLGQADDSLPMVIQAEIDSLEEEPVVAEFVKARERDNKLRHAKPFKGDNTALSGMSNQRAAELVSGLPDAKREKYAALSEKWQRFISDTRNLIASYELESQETVDSWGESFEHYVPLHREDMEKGKGIGQGFSVKGSETRARTGSNRKVVDILAHIVMQREKAIIRGEKAAISKALYGLAAANPNPDVWTIEAPPTVREFDQVTGLVVSRPDPAYKNKPNAVVHRFLNDKGHIEERVVLFNEHSERGMRLAEALKNLDTEQLGTILKTSAVITRWFSAINTQYNLVFGPVNAIRDAGSALLHLSNTPLAGRQKQVAKRIATTIKPLFKAIWAEADGSRLNTDVAKAWHEMQLEGGTTGYRDMFEDSKARGNELKDAMLKGGKLKKAQATMKWVKNQVSMYNDVMENASRLAVYMEAIEQGLSKKRAASLAKNITLNFNRKGKVSSQAGAMYAFFNASMQGTAKLYQTMRGPAGKQIVAGGLLLGASQAVLLAAAGFGDDEPPEFVQERSVILPIGNKKYLTIPMPLGFNIIPNFSRVATQWILSGFENTGERVTNLVGSLAETFNPIGNAGFTVQTIAPTVIDPLIALSENKDWTGKNIAKENFNSLKPTPGHSRMKDTASWFGIGVARIMNLLSGGTEYTPGLFSPTPDQIDYLIGQAFGGVGRESLKLFQAVGSTINGEDLPAYKIPLVSRFYGDSADSSSVSSAFYRNIRMMNMHSLEIEGLSENRGDVRGYINDNPEARLTNYTKGIYNRIAKLQRMKRSLIQRDAGKDAVEKINTSITNLMTKFNAKIEEAK